MVIKMDKKEFVARLRGRLYGLPEHDVDDRIDFYVEMIDDRIEEGISEEEAVSEVGSVEEIAEQILSELPLMKLAKEKIKSKGRLKVWEIVLLVLGSPIWLSLVIAAFSVILSLYISLVSVVISLWATLVSLCACAVGGAILGVAFAVCGNVLTGVLMIGIGIFCAGLAILFCFGCRVATKGSILLTQKIVLGIKKRLINKEEA